MAEDTTYLELSEESGAHKFYEVIVRDVEVSIRFGRIGDAGKATVTAYPSADKARAEAQKKIGEKLKKGYQRAVMGQRQKRSVTRRETAALPPPPSVFQAPLLWTFDTGARAFGVFVDGERCWVGNEAGRVYALTHDGKAQASFQLPDGVKCLIADADWRYAGCDDGRVYDLSGKVPRVAYEIAANVDIYWLDIADGVLAVSDANGKATVVNHEDESQWERQSPGKWGWMVRCDEIGVYHGHSGGVTMYDWEDGKRIWHCPTEGQVFFGWQEEAAVYAATTAHKVFSFSKRGEPGAVFACDNVVYSCAAAADGRFVFAGDNSSSIYCFDEGGRRLWKVGSTHGAALSMQLFRDRLYLVTSTGILACLDASEAAIAGAQRGVVPKAVAHQAPSLAAARPAAVETTSDRSRGVLAECYSDGDKLRVRVLSPGYDPTWRCQFPKDIREAGARYLIDEVRPAARGGFYRAHGDIRKLA